MNEQQVRDVAMRLLAQREHSRYELKSKLHVRKFDDDVITQILDELVQDNLQSDVRFAESYTRAKMRRGFGSVRIRQELHDRGIDDELIAQVLAIDLDEWARLVEEVRTKKFGSNVPKDFASRAKQMKFLQYRGFTMDQINLIWR